VRDDLVDHLFAGQPIDVERGDPRLVPPVHAYAHEEGRCAIVGGVVYRGDVVDELAGHVLVGDLCSGEVWALDPARAGSPMHLVTLDGTLVSFGVDHAGEVLLVDHAGALYQLVPD